MITLLSIVNIIDNSGGVLGRCIKVYNKKKSAKLGDSILITILKTSVDSKLKRGDKFKAILVRTKLPDKNNLSWGDNAVVLVTKNIKLNEFTPIGSRIKGPISWNIQHNKILAIAKKDI